MVFLEQLHWSIVSFMMVEEHIHCARPWLCTFWIGKHCLETNDAFSLQRLHGMVVVTIAGGGGLGPFFVGVGSNWATQVHPITRTVRTTKKRKTV